MPAPLTERWRRPAPVDAEGVLDAPVVAPAVGADFVVVGFADRVEILSAADGSLLVPHFVAGPVVAAPVIAGGEVAVATASELAWLSPERRVETARQPLASRPLRLTATAAGVVAADGAGVFLATGGREGWRVELAGVTGLSASPDGSRVYASTSSGHLLALEAADGAIRWAYEAGDGVALTTPVASGDRVYVGGTHDYLVALDAADGGREWRRYLGTDLVAAPAVTGKRIWATAHDADLYVYADNGTELHRLDLPARVYVDLVAYGPWVVVGPLRAAQRASWLGFRLPPGRTAVPQRRELVAAGSRQITLSPATGPAGVALINGDGTVIFLVPQQSR